MTESGNVFFDQFLRFAKLFGFDESGLSDSIFKINSDAFDLTLRQLRLIRGSPEPSPKVSWHFCLYLYHLGRLLYMERCSLSHELPFLVNKLTNGIDLFPEIDLGNSFAVAHTSGCVFAKASYAKYFAFHQNITVGRYLTYKPTLEDDVVMYPGSMIIGKCLIRQNTVLSAGTKVIGRSSPGNCVIFERKSGRLRFKPLDHVWTDQIFYRVEQAAN